MKNLLINYLSLVNPRKINYYIGPEEIDTDVFRCDGYQTNEPVTKYLMYKFQRRNEYLDYIISLKSEKVRTTNVKMEEEQANDISKKLGIKAEGITNITHQTFYEKAIQQYHEEKQFIGGPPEFHKLGIDIQDVPENGEILAKVIELAGTIENIYEKNEGQCTLSMDYTGGDRSAATIMIALSKLLENRGIKIDNILGVNFDSNNNKENPSPIKDKKSVNYIFDLIAGMEEFLNYGNSHKLNVYYEECGFYSNASKEVLNKINNLSTQLQLCRVGNILNSIGELSDALLNYEREEKKEDNQNSALFDYLVHDIKRDYGELFDKEKRTLLNVISWCLRKNMIQQAVTLYSERIAEEFVSQRVIYFSKYTTKWENLLFLKKIKGNDEPIYESKVRCICEYAIKGDYSIRDKDLIGEYDKLLKLRRSVYSIENEYFKTYLWVCVKRKINSKSGIAQCKDIIDLAARQADMDEREELDCEVRMDRKYIDKKDQVAVCLNNYYEFKSIARNTINHASPKPITTADFVHKLILSDEVKEKIKISQEEISINEFVLIFKDIIDQHKQIGMV